MPEDIRGLLCLRCCPKCGGALFRECDLVGCDVECLNCGYIMPKSELEALLGRERAEQILNLGRKRKEDAIVEKSKRGRRRKSAQ